MSATQTLAHLWFGVVYWNLRLCSYRIFGRRVFQNALNAEGINVMWCGLQYERHWIQIRVYPSLYNTNTHPPSKGLTSRHTGVKGLVRQKKTFWWDKKRKHPDLEVVQFGTAAFRAIFLSKRLDPGEKGQCLCPTKQDLTFFKASCLPKDLSAQPSNYCW